MWAFKDRPDRPDRPRRVRRPPGLWLGFSLGGSDWGHHHRHWDEGPSFGVHIPFGEPEAWDAGPVATEAWGAGSGGGGTWAADEGSGGGGAWDGGEAEAPQPDVFEWLGLGGGEAEESEQQGGGSW